MLIKIIWLSQLAIILLLANCRMEGAAPPPDGEVIEGYENYLEFWSNVTISFKITQMPL